MTAVEAPGKGRVSLPHRAHSLLRCHAGLGRQQHRLAATVAPEKHTLLVEAEDCGGLRGPAGLWRQQNSNSAHQLIQNPQADMLIWRSGRTQHRLELDAFRVRRILRRHSQA